MAWNCFQTEEEVEQQKMDEGELVGVVVVATLRCAPPEEGVRPWSDPDTVTTPVEVVTQLPTQTLLEYRLLANTPNPSVGPIRPLKYPCSRCTPS